MYWREEISWRISGRSRCIMNDTDTPQFDVCRSGAGACPYGTFGP